ncbi:MAG: hypothetical protein NT157_00395 [Candidatus Micrarchaeota archaeon]|nr:hypothetical protein [Candidatus Micrarchaeota archaeon]
MDELTFLDLVALQRIDSDSTVERFGSKINSSFFDAANLLGSLKIKGFINIDSSIGASKITVTKEAEEILKLADAKANDEVDELDGAVIKAVAAGLKMPGRISEKLNIRSRDLTFRIYKLVKKNYLDYVVRSGRVELILTEDGFKASGRAAGIVSETFTEGDQPSSVAEELVKEGPKPDEKSTPREQGAKKLDSWTKRKGKFEYYLRLYSKYIVILAVAILIIAFYLIYSSLSR